MRGKHVSVPMEELVSRAETLVKNGTKELLLIAQDSTYYGLDLYKKRNLAELMQRLSDINGLEWIRLHYAFPSGFPEDVLQVMAERENICKYIDMPLQHISDSVLTSMKRGTTKEKTNALLDKIRSKVPGIAIRTTLISGYPGETQKDHEEVLRWVEDSKFDRLGVFAYSHEENTGAHVLVDDVEPELKQERANEIMEIQQGISYELNQQKIGKTFKVLVDKKEGNNFIGRTEFDSPEVDNEVLIDAKNYCRVGDYVNIKIEQADVYDLVGNPV